MQKKKAKPQGSGWGCAFILAVAFLIIVWLISLIPWGFQQLPELNF